MVLQHHINALENIDIVGKQYMLDYFDHVGGSKRVVLKDQSQLHYIAVIYNSTVEIEFVCSGLLSHANVSVITICDNGLSTGARIYGVLGNNHTSIDIHIVSVLTHGAVVSADGCIDIRPGVSKVQGKLLEEYLIIGSDVRIKALPMLDVQSSDVAASHGARIERIDDKKLFYMMSKGISKSDSRRLMIQGIISHVFDSVRDSSFVEDDSHTIDQMEDRVIQLIDSASA